MDYNSHLANKGDSKSQRRWKRGSAGNQKVCFRITTDIDKEFGSTGQKLSASKKKNDGKKPFVKKEMTDEESEKFFAEKFKNN